MRPAIEKTWPGGEDRFRLGIGHLRAIEDRCDAGCAVVLLRLLKQQWKVDDVLAPIRQGLIGAGMSDDDARKKIDKATEAASLYALALVAADILRNFIMWEGGDQPGEGEAGTVMSES
ncbi:gene transfer agent family protein [Rhizobium sp. AAP43]|uniref:gene transfer agent family protein n=1 Tax=Rhizobium sp. AAP43 TaxID=1523420 RepID=UPI0006B90C33|nr:gene transfer agent family protein [Rhizobium sp. AAP43]KPF47066.1 hypothetical protein IP76_01835 [Rhizobium sp. AAP43]